MKSRILKQKLALPHWEEIEQLSAGIAENNFTELQTNGKEILCYRDLYENDITYHLIVTQQFDLFLHLLEGYKPLYRQELNSIIESVIKGVIKIKNEKDYLAIINFISKLRNLLKTEEGSDQQKSIIFVQIGFRFQFDIVIYSRFDYRRHLWELNLLLKIYKLLGSNYSLEEHKQIFQFKQQIEFDQLIISKKDKQRRLQHLEYNSLGNKYEGYNIYRQICDNRKWDKIINFSEQEMFTIIQDGLSPYMKMLQKAPYEFLVEYHNRHFNSIKSNIQTQRKKHGYNVLHCIAENKNVFNSQFVDILKELNLDEFKSEAYFDQIPLVYYVDQQKTLEEKLLAFLSNGVENKSFAELEGLQIIGQLQAKLAYESKEKKQLTYKPKYRMVKGINQNKNKKVKSLYKRPKNNERKECPEMTSIYYQIVQMHKIYHIRGFKQQFEISQYSFSNFHLNYQIDNVEQPIIIWNQDLETLKKFLNYVENEFGKKITQNQIESIQQALKKLGSDSSLEQLILQRKIIILNAVLKQNENQPSIQDLIKQSIKSILAKWEGKLNFRFYSYTKDRKFEDFLLCNGLIDFEQYEFEDPWAALLLLLDQGYRNQKNLVYLASKIPQSDIRVPVSELLAFLIPKKLRTEGPSLDYFIQDLFWNEEFLRKLQQCAAGIGMLFQWHQKDRFFRIEMRKILLQYNHDTYVPFFENFYKLYDQSEIMNIANSPQYRFTLCHIEQSYLKPVFYYQLKGINIKFNIRKNNFEASSIQEEVVIKQINENKTFFQVLASNDNYIEFTKEYLQIYRIQENKEEKLYYIVEALHNEAYQTLELLKDFIQKNIELYMGQRQYKLILFQFLKKVGPTYFGFSVKYRGKKKNIYPLEYDNLAKYVQVDTEKLNRQIQTFYKIFTEQIEYLETKGESFFVESDKQEFVLKQLLYYLNLESITILKKQVIHYINSASPRALYNYYKFTKNEEAFLFIFLQLEAKLNQASYTPFLFTELSEKMYEAFFNKEYIVTLDDKSWSRFTCFYVCEKYMKKGTLLKQFLSNGFLFDHQFNGLAKHFINTNQQRQVEYLMLFLSKFRANFQIIPPKSNYYFAFLHGPELGLNLQLFKEFVENNQIDEEKKSNILINLVSNGHYQKLQLIFDWISTEQELFYYTDTAVSTFLVKQFILNGKKNINIKTFLLSAPQYYVYSTFTSLDQEVNPYNVHDCQVNKSCLFQTNEFYTDFLRTATILYERLINQVSDYRIFSQNNQQFQLIFPNSKYLVEDPDSNLLKCIICLVTNNMFTQNWCKYLELIEQNIQYYDDSSIDLTFIFDIKIESKIGIFFKKMIDIFIKAKKLNVIFNSENIQGSEKYKYRRSQYLYNRTRFDVIQKNRFADILKNHFHEISFESIEKTNRHRQIYYGQKFQILAFDKQDLFIALMSRREDSILKILSQAQNIQEILTEYQIIQYLIMHGGEQSVIKVLNLVDQVNLEWFYYKGIPLLTYIVFKKWYKLYAYGEQYLFEQWTAKPNLLNQVQKTTQIELSIHQFATLNQFYVQNKIPLERKLLARTCSFLIPSSYNQSLPNYKVYTLLKQLFPHVPSRKLEIFSLQHQANDNDELDSFEIVSKRNSSKLHILKRLLGIYSNNDNHESQLMKMLFDELKIKCNTNLQDFTVNQLKKLFQLIYHSYGLYHPVMTQIIEISPDNYLDIQLLDNPKLAISLAQYGQFKTLQPFLEQNDNSDNLRKISIHLMKIILMVKYGHNYENLFDNQSDIHIKYYLEAYHLIGEDQNGTITNQFIQETVKILNINNANIQIVDYFFNQTKQENNQIKRALKLIMKLKEFNYQIQTIELEAIARVDYLAKNFQFEIADQFDFKRLGEENIISFPLLYEAEDLEKFLGNLPLYYKPEYEAAIINRTTIKKRKIKLTLDIKFEEKNLSHLYNDLRYQIYALRAHPNPVHLLEYEDKYISDEYVFVYTLKSQDQQFFNQQFYQNTTQQEQNKQQDQIHVYFNNKIQFNLGEIKNEIQQIHLKNKIDIVSFMECFFKSNFSMEQYGSWQQYCISLSFYETLQNIIDYAINQIKSIIELFDLFQEVDYQIKFEQQEFAGYSPKTSFLDKYFSFGKGSLSLESSKLIFLLPVSQIAATEPDPQYLNNVYNESDLNQFIKNQFGLDDELDALIYRFKLQQTLDDTCIKFRQNTNLDFAIEFNKSDIKNKIQSLPYPEQLDYLHKLQVYCENTLYIDLNNFIQSNRFSQLYRENLCSGKILKQPLKIGYLYNNIPKPLCNHFGFLQTKQQFLKNVKKGQFYHISYVSGNKYLVDFCKFIKFHKQKCYVKFISKKSKKKAISVSKIQSAILYSHQLNKLENQEDKKFVELLFIDNSGFYYMNKDEEFINNINRAISLPECIKVTRREFKLIFNKDAVTLNDFYFNTNDFRFKDIHETSFLKDKDYKLDRLKKQLELIKVVPALSEHVGFEKKRKTKEVNSYKNRQLLLILAQIAIKTPQKQFEVKNQCEALLDKSKAYFLQYCKQLTTEQKDFTKAGEQRVDKVKFFDSTNCPITKPVEELKLQCYIHHEHFLEIVYCPTIEFEKDYYKFIWTPRIKGLYFLTLNGEKTFFKFLVVANQPVAEGYQLENLNSIPYFFETELKFTLFDQFKNLITKLDKLTFDFEALSRSPNVTAKSRYECKSSHVALYLELSNSFKLDDLEEECDLEVQLHQCTLIKSLKIIAKPRELTQQRIQQFTQKISYTKTIQVLIQRNNFVPSLMQLRNKKGAYKLKINFFNELANDQGGPSREFFAMLGDYLKSQEYKLFRQTNNNNYFVWIGFFQENGSDLAYAIGLLLAYALANKFVIGISFALPFWKILIGLPIEFSDLRFIIDEQSFRSYDYLKGLQSEELQQLNLTFVNPSDGKNIRLNGNQIVVDKCNLDDYLKQSAMYLIYYQYEKIFKSMREGFNGQYDAKILQECFSLPELNKLIDQQDYKIEKAFVISRIKLNKRGGDTIKDYVVQYINTLDQQGLKQLLKFVTGSPYYNIQEFKIDITIDVTAPKSKLPTSRTCSNVLVIPMYQSYEVFRLKMDQALEWGTDFFGQN